MITAASAELPGRPESAGAARALVRQILGEGHPSAADATLIVSELVSNAVAHTKSGQPGGTITVAIEMSAQPPGVCIRVRDAGGPGAPAVAAATASSEHGRGLRIVTALATEWGSEHSGSGQVTWCRLADGGPPVKTVSQNRDVRQAQACAGAREGEGYRMSTTHEERVRAARAEREARARKFAADRGLSREAGDALARAVSLEPSINLAALDDLGPRALIEAAAILMPRAAHGPDHERGAREHLATAMRMGRQGRGHDAEHFLDRAGQEVTQADRRRREAAVRRAGAEAADQVIRAQADAGMSADRIDTSAERVLAGRFDNPTPESRAFYAAYDQTAAIYAADLRDLEAGQ